MEKLIYTEANMYDLGMDPEKQLIGHVSCIMKDKNGNVVFKDDTHNNIVLGVRSTIIDLLSGINYQATTDFPVVEYLTVGTGDKAETIEDTALEHEIANSKALIKMCTVGKDTGGDSINVTFAFLYQAKDANVDGKVIHEMGLWSRAGRLIARTKVGSWEKTEGLYLEIYWTIGYAEAAEQLITQ